ncbi:MAG: oligosaccharide flippase family protein [Rubricoccaceae bacterium]|nr:oligosaccharide flippase family protein [Rubricoccaceae bacterium]
MSEPAPTKREGLLKNLAWLTVGNAAAKPLWFLFITAICTRVLGAAEYGTLLAALALVGLVVGLTEMGTNAYVTRELSRQPGASSSLFTNLLAGRSALGLLAVALLPLGQVVGYATHEVAALTAAGAYTVAFRLNELCRTLYRAREVLRYEAASIVSERLLTVGGGLAGLLTTRSAVGTLLGMSAGILVALLANVAWIHGRLSPVRRAVLSLRTLGDAYRASVPIGLVFLFMMVVNVGGIVLVEATLGNAEAGRYGAAYKLLEMLQLLPTIICTPLLPRLSYLQLHGTAQGFRRVLLRSALGLTAATVAIAAVLSLTAPVVVRLLTADASFEGTIAILRVMAWAYPFMAVGMLLLYALVAADLHRYAAVLTAAAAVLSTGGLLALIPVYGALGAAFAFGGTHAVVVVGAAWGLRHVGREAPDPVGPQAPRPSPSLPRPEHEAG